MYSMRIWLNSVNHKFPELFFVFDNELISTELSKIEVSLGVRQRLEQIYIIFEKPKFFPPTEQCITQV